MCFDITVTLFQGQGQGQAHGLRSNFWHAAVDIRGPALPSAGKSKEELLSVHGDCLSSSRVDAVDLLLI